MLAVEFFDFLKRNQCKGGLRIGQCNAGRMLLHLCPCFLLIIVKISCATGKISGLAAKQTYSFATVADKSICRTSPGLTKTQKDLCMKKPYITREALSGINEAIAECQYQFQGHRWNCSSVSKTRNPYTSSIFKKGYKETAFAYAISSAGVVISLAKACSQGKLINCSCPKKSDWKWGSCSDNLRYGIKFSKMFLDTMETANDVHSKVNLHNNQVGRLVVANNMQVACKCHGISGSCGMITCWKRVPTLRRVGDELKQKYLTALRVDSSNARNGKRRKQNSLKVTKKRRPKSSDMLVKGLKRRDSLRNLVYYQKSPNFCDENPKLDISGTVGRQCNTTSVGPESCSTLCCGRGYDKTFRKKVDKICKFDWCCRVECIDFTVNEEITVCK